MKNFALFFILTVLPAILSGQIEQTEMRANVLFGKNSFSEAEKLYTQLIENNQTAAKNKLQSWYLKRAESYLNQNKLTEASNDLKVARQIDPQNVYYDLAKYYAKTGNVDSTFYYLENHLKTVNKKTKNEIEHDVFFANYLYMSDWNNLWSKYPVSVCENLTAEAENLVNANKSAEILSDNKLIKKYNNCPDALYQLARAYYQQKQYKQAIVNITKAIKLSDKTEYLNFASVCYESDNDFTNALFYIDKNLQTNQDDLNLTFRKASILIKADKTTEAETLLKNIIEIMPECDSAYYQLSLAALNQQNYNLAENYLNKALSINNGKSEYFVAQANIYVASKNTSKALDSYAMSLDLNPAQPEIYYRRALLRLASGDKTYAHFDLLKAQTLGHQLSKKLLNSQKW